MALNELIGLTEFQDALRELENCQQRKVLQAAAKAGADLALNVVRNVAPRRSGTMAEGLVARASGKESDINEATVQIKPSNKGWYWFFTNTGTVKMAGTHWFNNTMNSMRDGIGNTVRAKMIEALDKALRKQRG